MSSDFRLGAYVKGTQTYIRPDIAEKKDETGKKIVWTCPVCNTDAELRKGAINVHHFAHKTKKSCSYFERPGESDLHRAAKEEIKNRYETGLDFEVVKLCGSCRSSTNKALDTSTIKGVRKAVIEDPFDTINKRLHADLGLYTDEHLACIVEIVHTHKTEKRPEPWVELRAIDVLKSVGTQHARLYCNRDYSCDACVKKSEEKLLQQARIRAETLKKQEEDRLYRIRLEELRKIQQLKWIEEAPLRAKRQLEAEEKRLKKIKDAEEKRLKQIKDAEEEQLARQDAQRALDREMAELANKEWEKTYEKNRIASGYDTFYWACYKGNITDVKAQLETIDVNRKAKDGRTALMTVCEEGHVDLVRFLIERGAQINARMTSWDNYGVTAIDLARRRQHTDIISLLEEELTR
jgi:hypothetical protein